MSNNIDEKPLPLSLRVVPDTSIIIEGFLSRKIEREELLPAEVLIHEAVFAELESQANRNKETGFLGLEEVKKIRSLAQDRGFHVTFKGSRPTDFEIKHAKTGEIDSLIRKLAFDERATLVTADKVQSLVAESKGIKVILYEFEEEEHPFVLEQYFTPETMSVHIKENCTVRAKIGLPGAWAFKTVSESILDREGVKSLAKEIVEDASSRTDGYIEEDRKGSTIIQLANNRVVIVRPPFSDGYEITCVRPVKRMTLDEYKLPSSVIRRIDAGADGILIAGAPGHGKSTFAQSLALHYLAKEKIVKTIESPRDLDLGPEVTQYSLSHASPSEIQDVILLGRPDYAFFDEMRSTEDFRLFSDLRLSGVGMIGVLHATRPIDAIQRFLGRIDLGVIPHVVDTVIFIKNGGVEKIFLLKMDVSVPSGMTESDLARPVVSVSDFETGRLEFEIYTYGEETVVIPVSPGRRTPARQLAEEAVLGRVSGLVSRASVEMLSDYKCRIAVPEGEKQLLIGEAGSRINQLESHLGIHIDVVEEQGRKIVGRAERKQTLNFSTRADKKNIILEVGEEHANQDVDIYLDGEFFFSAKASKKGIISVSLGNAIGKMLSGSIAAGKRVELRTN